MTLQERMNYNAAVRKESNGLKVSVVFEGPIVSLSLATYNLGGMLEY